MQGKPGVADHVVLSRGDNFLLKKILCNNREIVRNIAMTSSQQHVSATTSDKKMLSVVKKFTCVLKKLLSVVKKFTCVLKKLLSVVKKIYMCVKKIVVSCQKIYMCVKKIVVGCQKIYMCVKKIVVGCQKIYMCVKKYYWSVKILKTGSCGPCFVVTW
jgi:hypothetical protein